MSLALGMAALTAAVAPQASVAADQCANQQLRVEQGATGLPECRAFEMVSPVDKGFGSVYWKPQGIVFGSFTPNFGIAAGATDGDTVIFPSWGIFAGTKNGLIQSYRSRRGASGWATTPTAPALTVPDPNAIYCPCLPFWKAASSDLGTGLMLTSNAWSPLDQNTVGPGDLFNPAPKDAYLRFPDERTELISLGADGLASGYIEEGSTEFVLAQDGGGALLRTAARVLPEDPPFREAPDAYLYRDGKIVEAAMRPDGTKVNNCGTAPAVGLDSADSALATNGAVAFEAPKYPFVEPPEGNPDCLVNPQLFLRLPDGEIIDVSASQRAVPDPDGDRAPRFLRMADDGSRLLFTSTEMLTEDAPAASYEYVYEYRVSDRSLNFLEAFPNAPNFLNVSEDASHAFVEATEALAPGGQAGEYNLYVLNEGELEWIASAPTPLDTSADFPGTAAISSPDGKAFTIATKSDLVGFDTNGRDQVYLHREGKPLVCASCVEGRAPQTETLLSIGSYSIYNDHGRYASSLASDGSAVAFETGDPLVPGDRDENRDVYIWNEGELSLLTPAPVQGNAYLLGMSTDARDVFFTSTAPVLAQDVDGGDTDIYDVRIEGGFPGGDGSGGVGTCAGESCQPPAAAPPPGVSPGSELIAVPPRKAKPRAKGKKGAKHCSKPKGNRNRANSKRPKCKQGQSKSNRGGAK